jgi:uncharacterized repeat protein (TIGR01451 family)
MPAGTVTRDEDVAPDQSPVEVVGFPMIPGSVLRFSASGEVRKGPAQTFSKPDGDSRSAEIGSKLSGEENGLSQIIAPKNALLGVFLRPVQPNQFLAPAPLSFSTAQSRDYQALSPEVQQVFFIGDGVTSLSQSQRVIVPAGATRLFLGTMDGTGWFNNEGAFTVQVTREPPAISIGNATVAEGNFGVALANFTVSLSVPSSERVTVDYETSDGTAMAGKDFLPARDKLTFDPGEISKTIGISVLADAEIESAETFFVNLRGSSNGIILDQSRQGTGTILADINRPSGISPSQNTPPVISAIQDRTIPANSSVFGIPFTVRDAETPAANLDLAVFTSNFNLLPPAGITLGGGGTNRTISLMPTRGQSGVVTIVLYVGDADGGSASSSFNLTVTPVNNPPTIALTSPLNGAKFTAPTNLTLTANASASAGSVAKVEFFQNTTRLGEDLTAPYSIVWTNALPGTNSLTAKVTDSQGGFATSLPVVITIAAPTNRPPILSSVPSQTINEGQRLAVTIQAVDSDLPAQTLTYSLDFGAPAGVSLNPTNGLFTWTPTEAQGPGTNVITIRVTDNGTPNLSAATSFTVIVNEVNLPPVLSAIGDRTVLLGDTVTFPATASDPDLPVNRLTFSLDTGAPAGAGINANSGVFTWTPTSAQTPSTNRLIIRVTDNGSPPLNHGQAFTIIVQSKPALPVPPTVSITSPLDRAAFPVGADINIVATAADSDGRISQVVFYVGSTPLATNTASPYSYTWANVPAGDYVLTATATDNQGLTSRSEPVNLVIGDMPCSAFNLAVDIVGLPSNAQVGDTLTFTNVVQHGGECAANGVVLTNVLSSHERFVTAQTAQGTWRYAPDSHTVIFQIGRMTSAARVETSITVNATTSGTMTNAAHVQAPNSRTGGTFEVTTLVAGPSRPLLNLVPLVNGQYALQFTAEPGRNYRLQASTDLRNWIDLTNTTSANLTVPLSAPIGANFPHRFYRAVSP